MNDLPGQTVLYAESADEFRQRIANARAKLNRARLARAEYLKQARTLRREEDKAMAEFLAATGDDQKTLDSLTAEEPTATGTETVANLKESRRQRVRDQAVRTLQGCGGHLSNKELAVYMGQDAHGLCSLLEGDERLEKWHGGREKNTQTFFRITEIGRAWLAGQS